MTEAITEVSSGRLQGAQGRSVLVFRNVPYARAGRFQPPEPAAAWAGVRDATQRGPICPQFEGRLDAVVGAQGFGLEQSEDCLNLTVTTPGLSGRRPVMMWIHGGAYMFGGGEAANYDADRLSAEGDVVVVSISYRLAIFGYLWQSDPTRRNLGLRDQVAALDWILANIERFGGDPENITLFGQSAGAHSIQAMLRAKGSPSPARRIILQSVSVGRWSTPEAAAKVADGVRETLGCDPQDAAASELVKAAAMALRTQPPGSISPFSPIIEGPPLIQAGLQTMIGWGRDDGTPHVALGAEPSPGGWIDHPATAQYVERVYAESGEAFAAATPSDAQTYLYRLDWRPEGSAYGACHCLELPLLFGDAAAWRGAAMLGTRPLSVADGLGRRMRAAWTGFARSGDPNVEGEPEWAPFAGGAPGTCRSFDV